MGTGCATYNRGGDTESSGWGVNDFGARAWLRFALLALVLVAPSVAAQNLIVNPGFENNPPPSFGNNIGHSITPWVLGGGNQSNVVKVDGGATFNYGNGGPALDADPSTGVGVRQHYLDIASGANDFYQAFSVPVCGGAPGQVRQATFSGRFSTRDNLSGSGSVSIRVGTGATGAVLANASVSLPAPVPPATSGNSPWVQVTGSVTVTAGSTISYVVAMDNNLNFDNASLMFDSAPCVTSQLTLQKTWVNANIGDTASVRASRGGTIIDTLASSAATANETDVDATPVQVFEGEAIDLSEVLGAGNGRLYDSVLTCTGDGTLSGTTLTVGNTGAAIVCRYTNTGASADVSITKTNTPGVNGNVDQASDTVVRGATSYTLTVRNTGPSAANGTIVRDPATPSLSCSSATCGNAQGGAVCPAVTVAALQLPAGVTIATLPANSSLEITLTCTVL